MDDLPNTMRIERSLPNALLIITGSIVFVLIGVFALDGAGLLQWAVIVFFGLCAIVALSRIVLREHLTLDREGWTMRTLGRTVRVRWDETSEYHVFEVRQRGMVVSRMPAAERISSSGKTTSGLLRRLRPLGNSFNSVSPGQGYTMPAEELTDLMNRYRDAAVGMSRQSGEGRNPERP